MRHVFQDFLRKGAVLVARVVLRKKGSQKIDAGEKSSSQKFT